MKNKQFNESHVIMKLSKNLLPSDDFRIKRLIAVTLFAWLSFILLINFFNPLAGTLAN